MQAPTCLKWDNLNIKKNNVYYGLKNINDINKSDEFLILTKATNSLIIFGGCQVTNSEN